MRKLLALCTLIFVGFISPALAQLSPVATTLVTVQSAATTNATSTKALPAQLYGFTLCNTTGAASFFKFYNKASAPTVGTDAVAFKIALPANACVSRNLSLGVNFTTGLAWATTLLQANSDTTAVAAGDVVGSFDYK